MSDPFDRSFRAEPGRADEVEPGILRVVAPNPGPMTFTGTNSYVVGAADVVVIDPGPALTAHEGALLAAIAGRPVRRILVTHSHVDHSPLAARLAARTGAPVAAFGPAHAGRSDVMERLSQGADLGGAEGIDASFEPDEALKHEALIDTDLGPLTALHTPGHLANHMCFALSDRGAVFSGDHVMGWATTVVSPPDGDLTQFMASLDLMAARNDRVYFPGHGGRVDAPAAMVAHQIAHRRERETQILATLDAAPGNAAALAQVIYTDVDPRLLPAAARNVLAHLIDLSTRGLVVAHGPIGAATVFSKP
ncbi:MAG: MBL fold metallo-hydrolase [Pseudomonadota bacterium]